jgi:hypothetical protein
VNNFERNAIIVLNVGGTARWAKIENSWFTAAQVERTVIDTRM